MCLLIEIYTYIKDMYACICVHMHTYTCTLIFLISACLYTSEKKELRNVLRATYRIINGIKCLLSCISLLIFTQTSYSQICSCSLLYSLDLEQCLAYSGCLVDIYLIRNEWSHRLILPNPFLAIFFYSHPTGLYISKYILYFAISICYFPCNLFC